MKIRRATRQDAQALAKISAQAFAGDVKACGSGPPGFSCVDHQQAAMARHHYYCVEQAGQIIAGFYYDQQPPGVHLHRLFVCPAHQRQGIGRGILNFLRHQGGEVELETPEFNRASQAFYQAHGFRRQGVVDYPGGRAVLMRTG